MKSLFYLAIIAMFIATVHPRANSQTITFPSGTDLCQYSPWRLVFHDEFNGNTLDLSKWAPYNASWDGSTGSYRTTTTGVSASIAYEMSSADDGKSFYDPSNIQVGGGNCLINLTYNPKTIDGASRVFTTGKLFNPIAFHSGKFEIRCRLPRQGGTWSAFWGHSDGECPSTSPPPSYPGSQDINFFEYSPCENDLTEISTSCFKYKVGTPCADYLGRTPHFYVNDVDNWHTYMTEWDENFVTLYVDGNQVIQFSRYEYVNHFSYAPYTSYINPGCAASTSSYNGMFTDNTSTWFPFYDMGHYIQMQAELKVDINRLYKYDLFGQCVPKLDKTHEELDQGTYMEWIIDYIRVYQRENKIQSDLRNLCPTIEGPTVICTPNGPVYTYSLSNYGSVVGLHWVLGEGAQLVQDNGGNIIVRFLNNGNTFVSANWTSAQEGACDMTSATLPIGVGAPPTPNVTASNPGLYLGHYSNTLTVNNALNGATYTWYIDKKPGTITKIGTTVTYISNYDPLEFSLIAENACGTSNYSTSPGGGELRIAHKNSELDLIYPNPANDVLNVKFSSEYYKSSPVVTVKILDVLGNTLKENQINDGAVLTSFTIKDLLPGIYTVIIGGDSKGVYQFTKL